MPNDEKATGSEKINHGGKCFFYTDEKKSYCNTWDGIWLHPHNSIDARPIDLSLSKDLK